MLQNIAQSIFKLRNLINVQPFSFLIVTNPFQNALKRRLMAWLVNELANKNIRYQLYYTSTSFSENSRFFEQNLHLHQQVVVLGGDGTLHLVVNCMAHQLKPIALLPCGTGNDFARSLGFTMTQFKDAIFSSHQLQVDLGKVGERYFINVAGIGFDGQVVAHSIGKQKIGSWAKLAYLVLTLKHLFRYQAEPIALKHGGKPYHYQHFMTLFANGRYFGGGMKVAPKANIADGELECVMIRDCSLLTKLVQLIRMTFAMPLSPKVVKQMAIKEMSVFSVGLPIEADGEYIGLTPTIIKLVPNAILIKAP